MAQIETPRELSGCPHGCLAIARALRENDCPYEAIEEMRTWASNFESFQMLERDELGHPNYAMMSYAAQHGYLDCLKSLHAMGVQWHTDLAQVAFENGQQSCLEYIENTMGGCTRPE